MDWQTFDKTQVELLKARRYGEAESELTKLYEEGRKQQDADLLEHSISRLAHFYSLPFIENMERAAYFFNEQEQRFPSDYSKLQTALFRFYCLQNIQSTIAKLEEITNEEPSSIADANTNFTATAMKGQCLLELRRLEDLPHVIMRLFELTMQYPDAIVRGDAFNFIEALISEQLLPAECRRLLDLFLNHALEPSVKERALALRSKLGQR